jgi:uncharacterized protein
MKKKRKPQEPVQPFPYLEKEVSFTNSSDGTILKGTLTLPDNKSKYPATILVTGSGAQDRDEEILGHKPFLVIADHLTKSGIAVLRYDDRHYKISPKKGWQYNTMDLAGDTKSAFDFLFNHINIDNSFIGIVGHSEGGLIAPIIASIDPRVAFIISLAGPGIHGKTIGDKQAVDFAEDQKEIEFNQRVNEIIDNEPDFSLRKQKFWKVFNSIYGMLHLWLRFKQFLMIDIIVSEWNRFFRKYNPADAWQKVKCPVFALNGEYDIQVYPAENLKAIEESLIIAGNTDYTTLVIPKANHLFQTVERGGPKAYSKLLQEYQQTEQTFSPAVLDIMKEWILKRYKCTCFEVSNER